MILAQTRIFAGPHNLLGLRGPAKVRACAKRALLDPKWSFAIPSNLQLKGFHEQESKKEAYSPLYTCLGDLVIKRPLYVL